MLRGGERPRGPPGHLLDEAAGQPLLPARPGVAWLPGAGQGQGEVGERRLACCQCRFESFRALQPGLFVTRRGRAPGPEAFVVLALTVERPGQTCVADGGVGVALAQGLEADRQDPAMHRLGLGVLPLGTEGHGQVVVAGGGVGVALAQGLEVDRQGPAVHRLGLGVFPLGIEGPGQVVVAGGGVGVVLAQGLELDRQGPAVQSPRPRHASPGLRESRPGCCSWRRCRGDPRPGP